MKPILFLLTLIATSSVFASSYKEVQTAVISGIKQDLESYVDFIDENVTTNDPELVDKSLLIYYSINEYGLAAPVIKQLLSKASNCRDQELIRSLHIQKSGMTVSDINKSHNQQIQQLDNCTDLSDSDKIIIYSNIIGSKLEVEELWIPSIKSQEQLTVNVLNNQVALTPRAAAYMFYTLSIRGLKVCRNYGNPNCSLFEKYFPDLKLAQQRLLRESNNDFDKNVLLPMQLGIIKELVDEDTFAYFNTSL